MRQIVYILMLSLLCGGAWAEIPQECSDTVTIASVDLPYTITGTDTCYLIDGNITTTGDGITINSAYGIVIDGQGDSVYFGTDADNSITGLELNGALNAYDIRIKNITFYHNPDDTTADSCHALQINGGKNVTFDTCNFHVFGHKTPASANEGNALQQGGSNFYNITFYGGTWSNWNIGYDDRTLLDGMVADMDGGADYNVSDTAYHFWIEDVNIYGTGGVAVSYRSVLYVCSIWVDARNERYTYQSANSTEGCANQAGIGLDYGWPGAMIRKNYIRAGTNYMGLDEGIILQYSLGEEGDSVIVDSNDVHVHFGFDPWYGWNLTSKAFKMRYENKYVSVVHNVFIGEMGNTVDTNYGTTASAIMLSLGNYGGREPDSFVTVQNNHLETIVNGSDLGSYIRTVLIAVGSGLTAGSWRMDSAGWVWQYNKIITNGWAYEIGGQDGYGNGGNFWADTIDFDTAIAGYDFKVFVVPNAYGQDQLNNYGRDMYYADGDPADVINVWPGSYERECWLERTCSLRVLDQGNNPVDNVKVEGICSRAVTRFTDTTNAAGWAILPVIYHYEADDAADTTDYNNYKFRATPLDSGDPDSVTMTVDWDNYIDTVTVAGVSNDTPKKIGAVHLRKVKL